MSTEIMIGEKKYILAEDVMNNAPLFFKGCRNIRVIITKEQIDENNYAYCQYINDKWKIKSGSSRKLDKLFLYEKWIEEHVPEYSSGIEYNIKEAPEIIVLEDSEKIYDNEGNVYDIEIRGERKHDKCYFLVNDVAKYFKLNNLYTTFIHESRGYEYNVHYKYFNCVFSSTKITKKCFLALSGFRRVLECSRMVFDEKIKYITHKWLTQFDNTIIHNYNISLVSSMHTTQGYTYCVTSNLINAVKIGFWRGNIPSLRARYVTTYGKNLQLFYVMTTDARKLESLCHNNFINMKLTNELYKKEYLHHYIKYLDNNK